MKRVMLSLALLAAWPGWAEPPSARIEDLAWLAGEWRGPGVAGHASVETYSAPLAGRMTGHFVQSGAKGVSFLELLSIEQAGDSLVYKLKHFDADLRGWEKPGEVIRFPLSAHHGDIWIFDALTIRREGPDRLSETVIVNDGKGKSHSLRFDYRRATVRAE